jgi:signal transduction histidine kinase
MPGTNGGAITALLPGAKSSVLLGTETGGLARWDGSALVLESGPAELPGKAVRCLFEDRKQRLWIGSWGSGAFCRTGERWVRISRRQGLASDAVGLIVQDEAGDYWFGTVESLYRIRAAEVEAFLEGKRSDVVSVPVASGEDQNDFRCTPGCPAVARTGSGIMWLATGSGLLPLSDLGRTSAEPVPPVILEGVLVDGRVRLPQAAVPLRLGTSVRSLDFLFTAIAFTAPQKARFRHKLENFDDDWVEGDVSRRAHYGPLPPGRYQFRVIACNADGVWNQTGASQALVVVPPVWRAWWFLTLCGLAAAAAIAAVVRVIATRRLRARLRLAEQRHAMDRERARIAQDMHDEIGSKLTRISFLSEIARHAGDNALEVAPPVEAIASTSRELLQALDEIVWAVNPRNDNLEHLAGYLEQHAREYFQKTEVVCEIQVPPQLPAFQLSAEVRHNVFLAFEEALNNTLKHARASRVGISMVLTPGAFEIRVEDNGQGFLREAGFKPEQDGLANMKKRLQSVGGGCDISSQPGKGTRICLRFPLTQPQTGNNGLSAEAGHLREVQTP